MANCGMILLIDSYDSFTFNLYQYIGEIAEQVEVVRNDHFQFEQLDKKDISAIVLSPARDVRSIQGR